MNFVKYITKAVETESLNMVAIGDRLANNFALRAMHSALGMITESGELIEAIGNNDRKNFKEEVGDLFWYIAIAAHAAVEKWNELERSVNCWDESWRITKGEIYHYRDRRILPHELIVVKIGDVVDILKKHLYYGEGLMAMTFMVRLYDVYRTLRYTLETIDLTSEQIVYDFDSRLGVGLYEVILCDNVKKLRKRYKHKFNEEEALNRDVEKELSHIK